MGWAHIPGIRGQEPPGWCYPWWIAKRGRAAHSIVPVRVVAQRPVAARPRLTPTLGRLLDALRPAPQLVVVERPRLGELGPAPEVSRWQLVVPFQNNAISFGHPAANELLQGKRLDLLTLDRPTAMQEWRLRSIYVPIGVVWESEPGEHSNEVVVITVTLRRGGDPVWAGSAETGRGSTIHSLLAAEQFIEPIGLRSGQQLTLDVVAQPFEALKLLQVSVGARYEANGGSVRADGVIDFEAIPLTGRRSI